MDIKQAWDQKESTTRVLKHQPKVNGRRVVTVMTVVRQLSRFVGPIGPQLSDRLPTGGRLPHGVSL